MPTAYQISKLKVMFASDADAYEIAKATLNLDKRKVPFVAKIAYEARTHLTLQDLVNFHNKT